MHALPTNVDATYTDSASDPSVKLHQQYHDEIHAAVNTLGSSGPFATRPDPAVFGPGYWMATDYPAPGLSTLFSSDGAAWSEVNAGHDLASAYATLPFTINSDATWHDPPGLSMLVPAGVPWKASSRLTFQVVLAAAGFPAAGTNIAIQWSVVDQLTAQVFYDYGIFQVPSNGIANSTFGSTQMSEHDNDPLPTDTYVKLSLWSSGVAGVTTKVYVPAQGIGDYGIRAVRA